MEKQINKLIEYSKKNAEGVYFLNTKQELMNFYVEGAKKYKKWKAISSIEHWLPIDPEFLQEFRLMLDKNKVKTQVIFKKSGLRYEPKNLKYRKIKTIPDTFKFKSNIDILDDKILIMNPDLAVLGLVIEIASILDIFHDTFDLLWQTLPENK